MPPTPLLNSNIIIADPYISNIISAIQRGSQNMPPSPAHRSLPVIDIGDSSDEDIGPSTVIAPTPSSTRLPKRSERIVIITSSDEDEDMNFLPQSTTYYTEYTDSDRRRRADGQARASKRAMAKHAKEMKEARRVSSSSYSDDGTLELIANLTIDDNDAVIQPQEHEGAAEHEESSSPHKHYVVTSPATVQTATSWLAAGHLSQGHPHAKAKRADPGRTTDQPRAKQLYEAYVVFAGLQPGIYMSWALAKRQVDRVKNNNFKGYQTRLHAERAWVLAHALGTAPRVLDRDGRRLNLDADTAPIPLLAVEALQDFPDEHVDPVWYVVSKGRTPGIYPAWNIAAHETQGMKHAVYEKYPTRQAALKAFDDAKAAGMVATI